MNAALYFELLDAIAQIDGSAKLKLVADRIAVTPMHPMERRVLDRALRARAEALDIHQLLLTPELLRVPATEPKSVASGG